MRGWEISGRFLMGLEVQKFYGGQGGLKPMVEDPKQSPAFGFSVAEHSPLTRRHPVPSKPHSVHPPSPQLHCHSVTELLLRANIPDSGSRLVSGTSLLTIPAAHLPLNHKLLSMSHRQIAFLAHCERIAKLVT